MKIEMDPIKQIRNVIGWIGHWGVNVEEEKKLSADDLQCEKKRGVLITWLENLEITAIMRRKVGSKRYIGVSRELLKEAIKKIIQKLKTFKNT